MAVFKIYYGSLHLLCLSYLILFLCLLRLWQTQKYIAFVSSLQFTFACLVIYDELDFDKLSFWFWELLTAVNVNANGRWGERGGCEVNHRLSIIGAKSQIV